MIEDPWHERADWMLRECIGGPVRKGAICALYEFVFEMRYMAPTGRFMLWAKNSTDNAECMVPSGSDYEEVARDMQRLVSEIENKRCVNAIRSLE